MSAPTNGSLPPEGGERPPERRDRRRRALRKDRRRELAERVCTFYHQDLDHQQIDRERRLQRYAKFRQWTSGKDWPWPDASDLAMPDIPTSVLRTEDTLHNAVMSRRPAVVSKALTAGDEEKQTSIDELQDYQLFMEQNGEKVVEEMIDQFVKEGVVTVFIPWVKERKRIDEIRVFGPIPEEDDATTYFMRLLQRVYPEARFRLTGDRDGWDWEVTFVDQERESPGEIHFYTSDDGEIEMLIRREILAFDGPKVIVPSYEDVLTPPRSANLQSPGPSNPQGAPHVILVDRPTVEEIRRLQRSGFYDLASKTEVDALGMSRPDDSESTSERQKDAIGGKEVELTTPLDPRHETVTRLTCFDLYDFDGDGIAEDVIFWVILEEKLLLKARYLTEIYPANPPRRPFAEASFLPVKGRREGVSLIELLEPLADWKKVIADLMIDSGTLTNTPFFFYRPASGLNPETFRPWPGDGIPLADPRNDVHIPNFQNATQAWAINLLAIVTQMEERLDLIGDLQLGRVPTGKSSALRTIGGMQTILAAGEARPERILRRFFMALVEVYRQMHELNQRYLPKKKQFRIMGALPTGQDPWRVIETPDDIRGRFLFDFEANVLNSSKEALQQSLQQLILVYANELGLRSGVIDSEGIYQLWRDYGKALGQQPDKYLKPPSPLSRLLRLNAEQAITMIAQGAVEFPWSPLEGAEVHLRKLERFVQSDELGNLDRNQIEALRRYVEEVSSMVEAERAQQKAGQAATQLTRGIGGGGAGGGPPSGDFGPTQISENELLAEDLPSAGGGANRGVPGGE